MIFCYRNTNRQVLGTMKSSVLKSRNITLLTKVCTVKAVIFPVVTYGCENWTIKKVDCWRIYAFGLWCWRRLLRVPWIAKRSNQSFLREINPEYSLEGPMLKLKLQYSDHLMQTADSLGKSLMLGKIEGRGEGGVRGWDAWMASPVQWTWTWANFGKWRRTKRAGMLQSMGSQRGEHDWATEQQPQDTLIPNIDFELWLEA